LRRCHPPGTPIQNNLSELFGLLNLLDPERYGSKEEFDDRFGADGVPSPDQIGELQAALRPILLRRMKEDVESLPEKEEASGRPPPAKKKVLIKMY
jgi:chromodomain-helicase-DNA-binding protein 7